MAVANRGVGDGVMLGIIVGGIFVDVAVGGGIVEVSVGSGDFDCVAELTFG